MLFIPGFVKTGLLKRVSLSHRWVFSASFYWKSKISSQKEILEYTSFHLIETVTSVLKVTKEKLSSLVSKIRHFKGQF